MEELKLHYNDVTDVAGDSLCLIFEGLKTPKAGGNAKKPAAPPSSFTPLPLKSIDLSMNQFSSKLELRLEKAMTGLI